MRAKDFLIEYDRAKTAQNLGQKLLDRAKKDMTTYVGTYFRQTPELQAATGELTPEKAISVTLQALENADPTPNKQYVQWLARNYANGQTNMEDVLSTIHGYLIKFHTLNQRKILKPPSNDINRYTSFGNFMDVLDEYPNPEPKEKQKADKGQAKEVYRDADVRIIVPEDEPAACYYGQGTRWCTATTRGNNYFNHYNQQGKLYVLLPTNPRYDGEKYQLHFPSSQFMNEQDEEVPLLDIIVDRFNLKDFFLQAEPELAEMIMFSPDDVLQPLLDQIKQYAEEKMFDIISEWELNDDYFRDWQRNEAINRGYFDADDNVDWDRVHEDPELSNYIEYNDEAREFYNDAERALSLTPDDARMIAADEYRETSPTLSDLEDVVMSSIIDETGRTSAGQLLAGWVHSNVWVREMTKGWSVGVRGEKR